MGLCGRGVLQSALTNNKDGFTTRLGAVTANLPAKPDTLKFNKVTIKGPGQAVQMFGPAQAAIARAVVDSVDSGVIPRDKANDYVVMVAPVRAMDEGSAQGGSRARPNERLRAAKRTLDAPERSRRIHGRSEPPAPTGRYNRRG